MSMYKILERTQDCIEVTSQELQFRNREREFMQIIGHTETFINTALKTPRAVQQLVDQCGLEGTGRVIFRAANSGNFRKILFLLEVRA